MTTSKTRNERLTITVNDEELTAIDNWRFENRLPSRAAAARELIGRGITVESAPGGNDTPQSRDVGVLASAIARATNECFVITAPHIEDNPIVYASPGFYRTTEYEPREVIGRNCRFLQGSETSSKTVAKLKAAIADERIFEEKILNYTKSGTPVWFHLHIEPIVDPESAELLFFIGRQFKVE